MKEDRLNTDKWIDFWNLYDKACWSDFLSRPEFKKAYKSSEFGLRGYIHDKILVPAIEEIESNLQKLDEQSKFLYWYRFKEELRITSERFQLNWEDDLDSITKKAFEDYQDYINGIHEEFRLKLEQEFFKWFYIAICSLKTEAEIFLNEVLFDLPVFDKSQLSSRNKDILEEKNRQQIVHIYNSGNINSIINSVNTDISQKEEIDDKQNNYEIVSSIIDNFRNQIENNGLNKLLYDSKTKKLRHESSAQLLFFSVAQIFCLANDIDVSPETNSGNGSVDFKFSKGFYNKINVEIKYSNHPNLKHGLEEQLKRYDESEIAQDSFFLILKVANNDRKISKVIEYDKEQNPANGKVKIVDARIKKSASKK